jgi:hypothetical protein
MSGAHVLSSSVSEIMAWFPVIKRACLRRSLAQYMHSYKVRRGLFCAAGDQGFDVLPHFRVRNGTAGQTVRDIIVAYDIFVAYLLNAH